MKAGIKNPIVTVDCGEQAKTFLRSAAHGGIAPCIVFLDIKMAGESGFDVLAWAREREALRHTAIYIISGSDEPADKIRAKELGATGYLVKHPKQDELARCVQRACNQLTSAPLAVPLASPRWA
jgi:CheY-like chemotaxis protein